MNKNETFEGVAAKNSEAAQQELPAHEVLAEEIKRSWDSRRRIVGMLVDSKKNDLLLQLIDNGHLKTSDVKGMFHTIDSDSLLYELAVRSSDCWEVVYLFRFIADKEIFRKMIEENGQTFKRFQDSESFNNYSDRVLEKFRSQLLRVFCDKLESNDVQLKIEKSH